ncbi:ribosomal protein S5 domain 2-type protein [Massariosphaeria phaeospora]|uniref:Ribosomal protein S5 domain 2-type protein n=1 Tax=Massariosphaeria phaeospora TaxID=100035 RepID=A0A7C8MEE4_9PLEO|nr:ribosomal protein S5 domain 2-type protein [Massariosphaeria phaeospora]
MSTTNDAIDDEVTSINSIFDEDTLSPVSPNDAYLYSLRLPSLPSVTLRIEFPHDYPDAPPSILGTQSVGEDLQKGVGSQVVQVVRDVLASLYRPGEACVYDLLEDVREALEIAEKQGTLHLHDTAAVDPPEPSTAPARTSTTSSSPQNDDATAAALGPPPPWSLAMPLTSKNSLFLARSAPVSYPAQARAYLAHLLATDKKAARATHNMVAWRMRGPGGASYQDCDDDGETAAGGRLLHLLQVMDLWGVMVVVSRWYGGTHLGPDRFRIIGAVARESLVVGGWVRGEKEKEGGKGGKGRK